MPITFRDTCGGQGCIWTAWGILTEEEHLAFYEDFLAQGDAKIRGYRFTLSDYSAVSSTDFSTDGIRRLAEMAIAAAAINPDCLVATVASQDLIFGLARMWATFIDQTEWEPRVFRSRTQAESWLRQRLEETHGLAGLELT